MQLSMAPSPVRQAGYTLAEMLAALLIVGLTMGGLVEASFMIGRLQASATTHTARMDARREVQAQFASVLSGQGPFRSDQTRFVGEGDAFTFPCGVATCGAALRPDGADTILGLSTPASHDVRLGRRQGPHFVYVGSSTTGDAWPPQGVTPQRLQAILLMSQDGVGFDPIATARIWRQEEPVCLFDAIVKDCRTRGS